MKRFLWLGVFFLSTSWLFFLPTYIPPNEIIGTFLLALGVFCVILGVSKITPTEIDQKYPFLLIPLLLSLLVIPFPYTIGVLVFTLGLLLTVFFTSPKKTHVLVIGTALSGLILILQTAVFPFSKTFLAHYHRIDLLSPVVSFIGSLLGLHSSTNNGIVFIQTSQQLYPFTTTWEKLGFYPWFPLFLGALILLFLFQEKRKLFHSFLLVLITSVLYLFFRYVIFIFGYLATGDLSIFWNPVYLTISFLPFVLLLMKFFPFTNMKIERNYLRDFTIKRKHAVALMMGFLFVFSFIGACTFQDPGTQKNGRILIDEYHSDWEDTTMPVNTTWYGLLSTYNYYSWAEWLSHYYPVERNMNDTLTIDLLRHYDILILKCPTESYAEEEIDAVVQFVNQGGGLYLIGDHTDVFGMNTFLNQIAKRFDIQFNTDATYEIGTGDLSIYTPEPMFPHPIVAHLDHFDFMTSCTLQPTSLISSLTMQNIIIGDRLLSEPGTYSTENFFRESVASPDASYGFLVQSAAITYGKGRVVAFTDSTVFSSFSVFSDGYTSFTLGVMTFLNRTNSALPFPLMLLALAVICLILFLVLLRAIKKIQIIWILLIAGLFAFTAAVPVFSSLNTSNYPVTIPQTSYTQVCFEQEYSHISISLKPTTALYNEKNNYGTFYVWTQRLGCVPSFEKTLHDALQTGEIVVIINPDEPFDETTIATVVSFVQNGGGILLMDSITNRESTANDLTSAFGIWINENTGEQRVYQNHSDFQENSSVGTLISFSLSLTGGTPVFIEEDNQTYAAMVEFPNKVQGTRGSFLVVVDSSTFSNTIMGGTFTEPDERQRQVYETEFLLFNHILLKQ